MLEDVKSKTFIDFYSNLTELDIRPGSQAEKEILSHIKANLKVIAGIPVSELPTANFFFTNDGKIRRINISDSIDNKYKNLKSFVRFTTHFFKTHHFDHKEVGQINQDLLKLGDLAKIQFDKDHLTSQASRFLYLNEIVDDKTAGFDADAADPAADLKVKANSTINETIKILQAEVQKLDIDSKKKSTLVWKAVYGTIAVGSVVGLTAVSTLLAIGSLFTLIPTLIIFLPLAFLITGFCIGKIATLENQFKAVESKWNASIDKIKVLETLRDNLNNPQQINYLQRFPNLVALIRSRPDLLVEKSTQLLQLIEQEKLCEAKTQEIAAFELKDLQEMTP